MAAAKVILAILMIAGTASAPGSYEITSGLVAEWHFDGTTQDSSGNGNHGTVYGAKYVDGIKGQALAFDGMDNYFSAPVSDALNSVKAQGTILAWINFSDTYLIKESGTSCSPGSRSLTLWRFGTYAAKSQAGIDCSGRLQSEWRIDDAQVGHTTGQPMISGKWTLVALSYDGRNGNEFFHMYFHGIIDEVKIYNRALSGDEILAYFKTLSSSTPGQKEVPVLENDNILKSETKVNDIVAYKPVEYSFTSPELAIYQIVVTGKENQYDVPIKVEALKWSPESLPKPAPGKVYRNLNIIADTKNFKEASISFRVENSHFAISGQKPEPQPATAKQVSSA